jgi:hypothetical protein
MQVLPAIPIPKLPFLHSSLMLGGNRCLLSGLFVAEPTMLTSNKLWRVPGPNYLF